MSLIRFPDTAFSLQPLGKKQRRIEEPRHLAFIRTLPSIISGQMGCEACHIRFGDPRHRKPMAGTGRKPDDWFTVPMTPDEHRHQHSMNEHAFYEGHGINDPCQLALDIYAVTGDPDEARRIIAEHLARIGRAIGEPRT
ncbi:DUF968 domain-containing protein [Aureimonas psammosilenae]|uniref:hypothetical protein n=1 Tax=Aureimonas psammosilenae TaxID=2495496 RepID=UPI001260F95C|nr:hypothetical protein [Aureimonas psammosilenae]